MRFLLLGPVAIEADGKRHSLRRAQNRGILALLALNARRSMSSRAVTDAMWGGAAPETARTQVHGAISQIRELLTHLGRPDLLESDRFGYRLNAEPDIVDASRVERLVGDARAATQAGDGEQARRLLRTALELFAGKPLFDATGAYVESTQAWLTDIRLTAVEDLADLELAHGRPELVAAELTLLVREHPLRERLRTRLLLALYRSGRQADALRAAREYRKLLAEQEGLDPGQDITELERRILRGDPSLRLEDDSTPRTAATAPAGPARQPLPAKPAAAAATFGGRGVRYSLPADTIAFTGRTTELAAITATVTRAAQSGGVVAIHAIDGMPGIGKTTLAVHAAHQLADRYPDGQIFLDLHAHTPGLPPTDPADALADLLRADGIDPRQLPDSIEARTALWRGRMTGRRAVLILDNVRSTAQISPLLPGSGTMLVLITSRRRLGDLRHAAHLQVKILPHADAVAMFLRLAPSAAAEPEAVNAIAQLVQRCDHLPLAIAILASRYAAHPAWTTADLLAEFRAGRERMLTVTSEEVTVHAAFDLSYRHLPPVRQRFFRLLGLTPGVTIDAYAAAALTGSTLDDAAEHLDELYNDHLLDETAPRRYRMHDLVRTYTHTLAAATEPAEVREQAVDRLLDYYQHTAHHADTLIATYTRPGAASVAAPAAAPDLPGWDHALAWLRAERPNLEACLRRATMHRRHHRIAGLTSGLATLLQLDGPLSQAIALHQNAVSAAATSSGDKAGHAGALHDLGTVRRLTGDYPAADKLFEQALTIHTEIGDCRGQANSLHALGVVRRLVGDYAAADKLFEQALTIHTEIGDRRGRANTIHDLGSVRLMVGDYPAADKLFEQALTIHTETGDRRGQANTLHSLGFVRLQTSDYPAADKLFDQALSIHTETGDRRARAHALHDLGVVRLRVGDYPAADNLLRQALTIHTGIGDRRGQANTIHDLGVVRRLVSDHPAAGELLHEALAIYTEIGNRHGQAITWTQLGAARRLTGDYTEAEDLLQQALTALRDIGAPDDEAEALNHLGILRRLTGYPDQAGIHHRDALDRARRVHHRYEEAQALEGIGRAAADLGHPANAITHLRQALDLYRRLGVPEADNVAAILDEVEFSTGTSAKGVTRSASENGRGGHDFRPER